MSYTCRYSRKPLKLTEQHCHDMPDIAIGIEPDTGFIQTVSIDHINDDYYADDDYFPEDVEKFIEREIPWNEKRVRKIQEYIPNAENLHILDFGCGSGGFLRCAKEKLDATGFDLSKRMCDYHQSLGLTAINDLDAIDKPVDIITLFHVLEHVPYPWELLQMLKDKLSPKYIILETPNADETLVKTFGEKNYLQNTYHSEHIWYYTNKTLALVAERADLKVPISTQLQRYALGNHFGWVKNGKGGGQDTYNWLNDDKLNAEYERVLAEQGLADSIFLICEPK